ncbi:unnamed protein product [Linum tenue]|uniref:Uncharacterized protein n=1 Tax=Linum tenue TaxID=586396 RepID=A0AAV0HDH2_9ROSI|nr:unnamed protein product [Linum tenue]
MRRIEEVAFSGGFSRRAGEERSSFSDGFSFSVGFARRRAEEGSSKMTGFRTLQRYCEFWDWRVLTVSNNYLLEGKFSDFTQYSMLQTLILSNTSFSGALPSSLKTHGSGSIPLSLFSISSLQKIYLSFNQLKGQALEFSNVTSLVLDTLDLSGNNLEGLGTLKVLLLPANRFTATVPLKWFQSLRNLDALDLSYNRMTVDEFDNQSSLKELDLSRNNIGGVVP